jgi:hypothetical protein
VKVNTILDSIDMGSIALPEFQRGYVWSRDQVRAFMHSLYRNHPVGSLLVWETRAEVARTRGDQELARGVVKLLLDGQQRITSLYGIIRGSAPEFFDGDTRAFIDLYFNLEDETFQFYAQRRMENNPYWVNVTELMRAGIAPAMQQLMAQPDLNGDINTYINRLNAIVSVKEREFHVEQVTGEDKTIDIVVDIFNRVNSGGTKLSKGDLALARICAAWPEARSVMKSHLESWRSSGFYFRMDWFLRCVNAVTTGEARFEALHDVDVNDFRQGLEGAAASVNRTLDLLAARLGIDHDRVLGSRYAFPLIARYMAQRGGQLLDYQERDRLLYWYIHTLLWGRYAGSTESTLNQDLEAIEDVGGALDRLIDQLRLTRGDLTVHPDDFGGWSKGTRFYPMLYILTRVGHARDWGTGNDLRNHFLHGLGSLQLHHVFPKALLYQHDYSRREVNALANFTFLTQETNLKISDRDPTEYFEDVEARHPGALASHWIPMDTALWRVDRYLDFLEARRELLAQATNDFLDGLLRGGISEETTPISSIATRAGAAVLGGVATDEEEEQLFECNQWVFEMGLAEGEFMHHLVDEDTGDLLAVVDLAWPNGLQEGLSQPVAVLLDEAQEVETLVNNAGFRYFTDLATFREYVREDVLALEEVSA